MLMIGLGLSNEFLSNEAINTNNVEVAADRFITDPLFVSNNRDTYEDEVGCQTLEFSGPARMRGNAYTMTTDRYLLEQQAYLSINTSTTLHFVVYECPSLDNCVLISDVVIDDSGTGAGYYSSGPINVFLENGKTYALGYAFEGSASYGNATCDSVSFGNLIGNLYNTGYEVYPPPANQSLYTGGSFEYNAKYITTDDGANYGCTDPSACNYDPTAEEDDGSCEYPEGTCDCDGPIDDYCDCDGSIVDECGDCGGDGAPCAESQELELPSHEYVYSSLPRGYWFTAPADFKITDLRVALEAGNQGQHVQVMLFDGEPNGYGYGNGTSFETLFYSDSYSGDAWIPCDIDISEGDVIGILGIRDDGNLNNNSYGNGYDFTSYIGDYPVQLTRIINQETLLDGPVNSGSVYEDCSYGGNCYISRVEMKYLAGSVGCTDPYACNYDPTAEEDDGSCEYPEGTCDCDGPIDDYCDCDGNLIDACGECGGDGYPCDEELVITFTNCGQEGRYGPSQNQCDNEYAGTDLDGEVTLNGGIQEWTVIQDGLYTIETYGAQGGDEDNSDGYGAKMVGDFELEVGDVLKILVGQEGAWGPDNGNQGCGGPNDAGSGGGGTFVALVDGFYDGYTYQDLPLIISGGGGGHNNPYGDNTEHTYATIAESGITPPGQGPGQGGLNGGGGGGARDGAPGNGYTPGGIGASCSYGPGGGGFYSNGGPNCSGDYGTEGYAFINGGQGGDGTSGCNNTPGGFGGGAYGGHRGGGGGGYSGGGGCGSNGGGGGGGSYNSGANQDNESGYNEGHGYVVITYSFPNPASGDVNGDGEINIYDILIIVNLVFNGEYNQQGDIDGDGMLNIADLVLLVNLILNN